MTKIGFVGSGEYKDRQFVIKKLNDIVNKKEDIIVSGRSPRNKYNNVDIWAENWAYRYCRNEPIIHPAKEFTRNGFYKRNKLIAIDSNKLIVFINQFQHQSGAWNTVKYFIEKPDFDYDNLKIYNELHQLWEFKDLPPWIGNKIPTKIKYKFF